MDGQTEGQTDRKSDIEVGAPLKNKQKAYLLLYNLSDFFLLSHLSSFVLVCFLEIYLKQRVPFGTMV